MTMTAEMAMAGLRESAASVRPSDHPRADDLLEIGEDLARTLAAIRWTSTCSTGNTGGGAA